jgi:hypothetical protein
LKTLSKVGVLGGENSKQRHDDPVEPSKWIGNYETSFKKSQVSAVLALNIQSFVVRFWE